MSRLGELVAAGQSPWLDYIRRSLLTSGDLQRMVEVDGITGATTNPTIFDKAIAGSSDYDDQLRGLLGRDPTLTSSELFERLAVEDVTRAADVFRPVFDRTAGADGYVSIEVSPRLAHDTAGTVAEARRLWAAVDRPNVLIKVPATPEGVPAVEQLLASGVNVNITLMFSQDHYEAVAQAYLRALARTPVPARLASVASVFVSRIDSAVDPLLDKLGTADAKALRGQVAVANGRVIYARYRELFHGLTFAAWSGRGARPQRVLWASTSTKDPSFPDTKYVEELVGPETVDTIPPATVTAFEDHGVVHPGALVQGVDEARSRLDRLHQLGIDLHRVTEDLQTEGVASFAASYDHLLASLESKRAQLLAEATDPQQLALGSTAGPVTDRIARWQTERAGSRVWAKDASLWPAAPASDVRDRLGWLQLPELMHHELEELNAFAEQARAEGIRHIVVLGMGGSSLAPDVFARMHVAAPGYPELLVLDSTHPDAVTALAHRIDLRRSLFLVSSKSGTTIEPLSFFHYFWDALATLGLPPDQHFVAITDPGTPLVQLATDRGFRETFLALPTVGGRYSALTHFGLVPAALAGVDIRTVLDRARTMALRCGPEVSAPENPAVVLAAVLGELAVHGRDKVTFYASPGFAPFPDWVEQLIAESTGKIGKGIVPVVDEPMLPPEFYGSDRLFVEVEADGSPDPLVAAHTARLEASGQPVVRLSVPDRRDLGEEFFRWEFAVALAGSVVGIDPFDQPDVEFAKELARTAMAAPPGTSADAGVVTHRVAELTGLRTALTAWRGSCRPGDYVALQAYLAPTPEIRSALDALRTKILRQLRVATTLGFGPRFLHSTGQLHKGGPPTGLFLQIVDTPRHDVPVPDTDYTFGQLIRAQAIGDYRALTQRGRRVLRVDLAEDVTGGLARLTEALDG